DSARSSAIALKAHKGVWPASQTALIHLASVDVLSVVMRVTCTAEIRCRSASLPLGDILSGEFREGHGGRHRRVVPENENPGVSVRRVRICQGWEGQGTKFFTPPCRSHPFRFSKDCGSG